MISRCTDPNNAQYHDYGGRGIKVHPEWLDFEKFYAAVRDRPAAGLTFDREDNDGNYEPGNVRWATWAAQTRNKRTNRMVVFNGWNRCVQDWANELGVTWHHLYRRHKRGMTWQEAIQDVIDHPPKVRGPYRQTNQNKRIICSRRPLHNPTEGVSGRFHASNNNKKKVMYDQTQARAGL